MLQFLRSVSSGRQGLASPSAASAGAMGAAVHLVDLARKVKQAGGKGQRRDLVIRGQTGRGRQPAERANFQAACNPGYLQNPKEAGRLGSVRDEADGKNIQGIAGGHK